MLKSVLSDKEHEDPSYLVTGAALESAAVAPDDVGGRSEGPEMDARAELRLLKTLLARRTNLDRPLRSSSDAPGAVGLMTVAKAQMGDASGG